MFAGIIAGVGTVVGVSASPRRQVGGGAAYRLDLELGPLSEGLALGASVAVNGVCLTLAELRRGVGGFDVVPETWGRTTLAELRAGEIVNLERSLRVGDPIDGHFVQGHVEGVGTVDRLDHTEGQWKLWVRAGAELMHAIVPKGSIAIDGTSLTVVDAGGERFSVALVPTTLQRTVLGRRKPGDRVNLETDIVARVILARLGALLGAEDGGRGITLEALRAGGFIS
jgi:riboflavin synthase